MAGPEAPAYIWAYRDGRQNENVSTEWIAVDELSPSSPATTYAAPPSTLADA